MRVLCCAIALLLLSVAAAFAHTPLCACTDNGDGTILCEGGFSDGSSASGVTLSVLSSSGAVLAEGKMNDASEFVFDKPKGDFTVRFDGGEGHVIAIKGAEIR